jgi:ketosteroid isomerase-like protein
MSQENVEIVRSIYRAHERGDFSSVEWAHPEIEFVISDGPSPGRWTGLAGMAEAWRDFLRAWEEYRTQVEEYRQLDGERILVLTHRAGRGKTSGMDIGEMHAKGANLFHLRDGKVIRLVFYRDRERALEAVGLRE